MTWVRLDIDPMGAPRQSRRDAWNPRPVVLRYRAYRDALRLLLKSKGLEVSDITAGDVLGVRFVIAMSASWSKRKKAQAIGRPHQQKPDLDNLIKGFKDALMEEDSHIWSYDPPPTKRWGESGYVEVKIS